MEKIDTITERFATRCKNCNRLLTNPGYHQNSVFCCGRYRQWTDTTEYTYQIDDGRDELGRFHHQSKRVLIKTEIINAGG